MKVEQKIKNVIRTYFFLQLIQFMFHVIMEIS